MDRIFAMMDEDPDMGPKLRDADVPQRFEFEDVDLVMNISDHVIVLHQGQKLFEGPPAEVRNSSAVRAAYLGADHGSD